jgi:hypothetical protein
VDDGRSIEESIYEEPPSLIGSQPTYATQQGDDRDRAGHDRRRRSCYEEDQFGLDTRYHHGSQEPAIEMRPNWRQYLLDGAIRQPTELPMGTQIIGMLQQPMPICLAPGPLLPHMVRPARGLTRRH